MKVLEKIEKATKLFYLKTEIATIEEMSARLFWIPNSLVIWMGCNIFSKDFTTKSIKFFISMMLMLVTPIALLNSLFYYRGDMQSILFIFLCFGTFFQVSGKLYAFIIRRPDLMKSVELCESFLGYLENNEMRKCFENWIMIGFYAETILSFLFFTVLIFFITYPAFVYLIFGYVTMICPLVMPFTDDHSIHGFTLNYLIQAVMVAMAILGSLAAIMDVVIFVVHFLAFFESLEIMLKTLQKTILIPTEKNSKERLRVLKKIALGHNWCYEYLDNFENCFQFYHLCDIASAIFGTVICLYGVTTVRKFQPISKVY